MVLHTDSTRFLGNNFWIKDSQKITCQSNSYEIFFSYELNPRCKTPRNIHPKSQELRGLYYTFLIHFAF